MDCLEVSPGGNFFSFEHGSTTQVCKIASGKNSFGNIGTDRGCTFFLL